MAGATMLLEPSFEVHCMTLIVTSSDREQLQQLEESLWREDRRFDRAWLSAVLSGDFFEIGRSGQLHQRRDVLLAQARTIGASLPLSDLEVRLLADDVALVTYICVQSHDGMVTRSRRSSLWSRSGTSWVLRFHQGTGTAE
jgi:hypothetical protein